MVSGDIGDLETAGLRFQIAILEEAVARNPTDTEALRYLAHAYTLLGRTEDGLQADRRLVELLPQDARARYNLACSCALAGRREEALVVLTQACEMGFDDLKLMRKDADLDTLRDDPRYRDIEERLQRRKRRR